MLQRGFTLLELLVSMALLTILLGVGLPSLQSLLTDNRARFEQERILKILTAARLQAISDRQTITVCTVNADNLCVTHGGQALIMFSDDNGDATQDAGEARLMASPGFSDGLSLTSSRTAINFAPDGTTLGSNATLQLCVSGQPRIDLVISMSGRAQSSTQSTLCP